MEIKMRRGKFDVDRLRVASPCPMSWEQMTGDDQTRHCSLCDLNVHNIAGLPDHEVEKLVGAREGRLCVRLSRRADGTVIVGDCPVGLRKYRRQVAAMASAAFAALLSLMSVSYAQKDKNTRRIDARKIEIVRTRDNVGGSSIAGTLLDPAGAVIPLIEVRLFQGEDKDRTRVEVSDEDGRFSFGRLTDGIYTITIRAANGFQAVRVENIDLKADEKQEMNLEIPIDPGAVTVGILIDASIDLTTNEQTTVFTRDMIDRIPGRRPFD
jgi:hypothetical protein